MEVCQTFQDGESTLNIDDGSFYKVNKLVLSDQKRKEEKTIVKQNKEDTGDISKSGVEAHTKGHFP